MSDVPLAVLGLIVFALLFLTVVGNIVQPLFHEVFGVVGNTTAEKMGVNGSYVHLNASAMNSSSLQTSGFMAFGLGVMGGGLMIVANGFLKSKKNKKKSGYKYYGDLK